MASGSGDYLFAALPPGTYTVSFELTGFQTVTRTQQVASGYNGRVDATMSVSAVAESVTVVGADAQPLAETAQVATTFKQDLMATLPSNRTIDAVMLMAPSVHATGPRGAFSVNGALSYENLYTLNGAVIVENLRGAAYPLYIEDALQEVTVATAGVSAEYGRFSGGMISAVTKSGGDTFSGSLRTSFANDYWRSKTPAANDPKRLGDGPEPVTNPMYEATLGGPIAQKRLWFFGAARIRSEETVRSTLMTNQSYTRTNDEKRYEGKLTYAPRPAHSLQGSYIKIDQMQTNFTSQNVMDLASLATQVQPSDLLSLRYSGIVSPNFSVEAQYSSRHLTLNTRSGHARQNQRHPARGRLEKRALLEPDVLQRLRRREPRQRRFFRQGFLLSVDREPRAHTTWSSATTASTTRCCRTPTPAAAITGFRAPVPSGAPTARRCFRSSCRIPPRSGIRP